MQDLPAAAWRTSTLCDLNGCVEVALLDGQVAVRDAKDRTGPVLLFTAPSGPPSWAASATASSTSLTGPRSCWARDPAGGLDLRPARPSPVSRRTHGPQATGRGPAFRARRHPAGSAESADDAEPKPRRRRGRKLVLLAALAGAATYLVRRNQRKAELDEGIWHEAPTPTPPPRPPGDAEGRREPVHLARRRRRGAGDWHFPYFNDEMGAAVGELLGVADTLLLGRKTYDDHAGAWPEREAEGGEDAEFAKVLGDARKIVVTRQRLELTWRNSERLEGDLVEAVTALKNEPGGPIAISGSVSVVRQLLAAGCWTSCTCWCTRSPSARACGCSTRASPRSR